MENFFKRNIAYLKKKNNETYDSIGLQANCTGNTVSFWINKDFEPRMSELEKLAKYFEISLNDLLYCDLSIVQVNKKNTVKKNSTDVQGNVQPYVQLLPEKKQSVQVLQLEGDMVQIPITDISVAAGTGVFNSDYMENVAHFSFPNHLLKRGATYLSVRIRGASMAPTLQDGGYMAIRLIERPEWANITDERVFVVCDTEGKSYLKRIKNRFKKGFIVLMSDSPDKASYPNFNLQADEIQSIWEAEFYISAKMPNIHSQYYSRLAQLEDKVDDLLKLLPKIEQ